MLWPVLPVAGAGALLLAQTGLPALGWVPPVAALVWLLASRLASEAWAWALVAGVFSAALLGLAERRGTFSGRRVWAYLPALALAVILPLAPNYAAFTERLVQAATAAEAQEVARWRTLGLPADQRLAVEQMLRLSTAAEVAFLRNLFPALLFGWVALLVNLSERLARRLAELVRKPLAVGVPLAAWRVPDGVVWLFVAGLAATATRNPRLVATGLNVAVSVGLAFGLQGLAVLRSFLLAHGMTPGLVAVLFILTSLMMGPVLPLAATGVGLMDLWLDFRRLEPQPEADEPEGGNLWK